LLIKRRMKHAAALLLVMLALGVNASAQGTTNAPAKRTWLGRMLHPFNSASRLPEYNDPRLRGLVLRLELSPQPVKLSEVRLLNVKVTLTNMSKRPIELQFPDEQRIEVYLLNSTERVLTKWSDNHAFEKKPGSILINPDEHIEYNEKIATRDLAPNTVFIAEVFFPRYPDLRIRQKFLTAP
jgi:intracellular proteinase inhibitor BsuPI